MKKMTAGIAAMMIAFGTMTMNAQSVIQQDDKGQQNNATQVDKTKNQNGNNSTISNAKDDKNKGNGNQGGHFGQGNGGNNNGNHNGYGQGNGNNGYGQGNGNHNGYGQGNGYNGNQGHFGNGMANHYGQNKYIGKIKGNYIYVNHCTKNHRRNIGNHTHKYYYEVINGKKTYHKVCAYCGKHK